MKKVLYLLLLSVFSSLTISAQDSSIPETSLFKVENDAVIWQKIYDLNVSAKEYLTFIKLKNCLEGIDTVQTTIIGKLKGFKPNTYGAARMSSPIYLFTAMIFADARIEIKENKYRVTLSNIKATDGLGIVDFETLYFKMLSKKTARPSFFKIDEPILNKNFDSFFEYKKITSDF
ncbi:hypothetical protein [Emticicia sp. C21]|uniref:hypothetical protein n=1 Tax=Emticicia sp. C21 TaxID=2302915 RepID=UPI000E354DC4|nr:hypothetical protein [Emticicia sp. C21]RFS17830.1 hypothetical protein D0T08_00855 [Emticicia sp. C21]